MSTNTPAFEPYVPENVALFEALYGPHLISLGGSDAIDMMFSDVNVKEMRTLDIGFGLGGVAFYLAERYQTHVTGVEIHPWMVSYAKTHSPIQVRSLLDFYTYDSNGKLPFATHSFDIAYSKGVLNHVKDKAPLFQQIYASLKPGGSLVIADWIFPEMTKEAHPVLATETQDSYQRLLEDAGFKHIIFRDDSHLFSNYVVAFLSNLEQKRALIEQGFGETVYDEILQQHRTLLDSIKEKRKLAVRILAQK